MGLVSSLKELRRRQIHIAMAKYIQKIAGELYSSHGGKENGISGQFNLENLSLTLDTAIPCGLLLTELLTNAFKHAFARGGGHRGNSERSISIALHGSRDGQRTLTIRDNGIGLPEDIDLNSRHTMGPQLVSLMVEQLNSTITLERKEGTGYTISFSENYEVTS